MPSVLIVDDLPAVHEMLEAVIAPAGFVSTFCLSGEEALDRYKEEGFDIVLADITMQPMDGITLLKEIKAYNRHALVIMMTGYASTETATQALKYGAFDYVQKPFRVDELVNTLNRAMEVINTNQTDAPAAATIAAAEKVTPIQETSVLLGDSPAIQAVAKQVRKLVGTMTPVLITGEPGTGKRAIAELLHREGPTKSGHFKGIDCTVAYEDELDFKLFEHDGSAGALIQELNGGTLFLNQIEALPKHMQDALANVLQVSGGIFRLICGSTADIEGMVDEGSFSEEFFKKVATLPIFLPPLRHRPEDIPAIVIEILNSGINPWYQGSQIEFTQEAEDIILSYPWPGNVTELSNVVCAVIAASKGRTITEQMLPKRVKDLRTWPKLKDYLSQREKGYLREVLKFCNRDKARAAEVAGVDESVFE